MSYLVAAVVLVGALCVLNLLLSLAVIRRLRTHTALLAGRDDPGSPIIGAGERPGSFAASDIDGNAVTLSPAGPSLVGFFSPECRPCRDSLPEFVAQAADYPGGRDRVVAVVSGDSEPGTGEFTAALAGVSRVVVERGEGEMTRAFRVVGFPSWCVVDTDGTVRHTGNAGDRIPVGVAA